MRVEDFETFFANHVKVNKPFMGGMLTEQSCTLTPIQKTIAQWLNNRNYGIIKTQRRSGMSTFMCAYLAWQLFSNNKINNTLVLCSRSVYCEEYFNKITDIIKDFPLIVVEKQQKGKYFKYIEGNQIKTITFTSNINDIVGKTFQMVLVPDMAFFNKNKLQDIWPAIRVGTKKVFVWSTPSIEKNNIFRELYERTPEENKASVYMDKASWKQMYGQDREMYEKSMKDIVSEEYFETEVMGNFINKEKDMKKNNTTATMNNAAKYSEAIRTMEDVPEFTKTSTEDVIKNVNGETVAKITPDGTVCEKPLSGIIPNKKEIECLCNGGKCGTLIDESESICGVGPVDFNKLENTPKMPKQLLDWDERLTKERNKQIAEAEKEGDKKFNLDVDEKTNRAIEELHKKKIIEEADNSSKATVKAISERVNTDRCKELMNFDGKTIYKGNGQPSDTAKEMIMKIWSDADGKMFYADPKNYGTKVETAKIQPEEEEIVEEEVKKLFRIRYDNGCEAGYYYIAADYIEDVFKDIMEPAPEGQCEHYITSVEEMKVDFKII